MSELGSLRFEIDDDDVVVARLSGEVDVSNASALGEQLVGEVPNRALGLVLDLSATDYLDSSGVSLVFDLAERLRRRQQELRLVVPETAPLRRVLRIVAPGDALPIVATVDEAASAIRAAP